MSVLDGMRSVHVLLGSVGFALGLAALLLPKFGRKATWHRWIGRGYAIAMLGMAGLSIPLAYESGSTFLLIIGVLTFGWVVAGWIAIRRSIQARRTGPRGRATTLLRTHLIFMGSSYVAAWTAFLVNVEPLGVNTLVYWLYALGPTVIGTILIARTSRRYARHAHAQ